MNKHLLMATLCLAAHGLAQAQTADTPATAALDKRAASNSWQFGAVLDTTYTSRALAAGARDRGLQLGHSDLSAGGPLGEHLRAFGTLMLETHDGKLEHSVEEAWVETRRLPAGLQVRAGRFASQIGHLNQQHMHADDFTERPLLYRAFFGGHWNDDGLRLSWTAPTAFYLTVGAEVFRGKKLVAEAANKPGQLGAATLAVKMGADLNRSHSWQIGLSHLLNRREAAHEDHHAHEEEDEAGHDEHHHHHHHGAQFSGRRTWMIDATWKWAPDGNNRNQQLRLSLEAAQTRDLGEHASSRDKHEANAIAAVWRFHPSWEVGARADWLRVRIPHEDHFHGGLLRERSLMLAWKPTHQQALRLQFTTQRDAVGFESPAKRSVQLQYVMAFGAHSAHSY